LWLIPKARPIARTGNAAGAYASKKLAKGEVREDYDEFPEIYDRRPREGKVERTFQSMLERYPGEITTTSPI
jgi:hypothetical protein